jgi:hypothetical protein
VAGAAAAHWPVADAARQAPAHDTALFDRYRQWRTALEAAIGASGR